MVTMDTPEESNIASDLSVVLFGKVTKFNPSGLVRKYLQNLDVQGPLAYRDIILCG